MYHATHAFHRFFLCVTVIALLAVSLARAEEVDEAETLSDDPELEQFAALSLEDLMNIEVTTLAGVGQEWFTTPTAMHVITGEEIRRAGLRSLPEALRLAPGVFVGQTNSSNWSVGMRGFNGSLANKTLVLIDGRAVYDTLFGGTFWTIQDVLLEDVDRIEVIRGPGSTLWGANAVNGVINVITKSAKDTQGLFVETGGGNYERGFASVRFGFKIGEDSWLSIYGKWFSRDHFLDASGESTHDDWDMSRAGFRFDHEGEDNFKLTLQGDAYYSGHIGEFTPNAPVPGENIVFVSDIRDVHVGGGNILLRLSQEDDDYGWSFQTYYDHRERLTNLTFKIKRDVFDVDWRHYFLLGDANKIIWGLGARVIRDSTEDGSQLLMRPQGRTLTTYSAFVQDTITLVPDRFYAMIGSKFENNTYTDFEMQPSARLWWTPDKNNTLWASISRAVRIPSRSERDGMIVFGYIDSGLLTGGPLTGDIIPLGVAGNSELEAEELTAYEAGYRTRVSDKLTIDAALFYNDYNNLIYVPSVIEPFNNDGFGESYGGEIALTWQVADNWKLQGSYSYVNVQIHGPVLPTDEGNTPHNMVKLNSQLDLTDDLEFNAGLYYVDNIPSQMIDSYIRLDVGFTWRPTANFELSVWGQNLLDSQHPEFSTSEVPRSFYVMGTFRF